MTTEPASVSPSPVSNASPNSNDPYEFTTPQNVVIAGLSSRMQFVGIFLIALGIAAVLSGATRQVGGPILYGLVNTLVGLWTYRAGSQFRGVVATKGHDLSHLMSALEELRRLYTFQYWLCLAAIFGVLILLATNVAY